MLPLILIGVIAAIGVGVLLALTSDHFDGEE